MLVRNVGSAFQRVWFDPPPTSPQPGPLGKLLEVTEPQCSCLKIGKELLPRAVVMLSEIRHGRLCRCAEDPFPAQQRVCCEGGKMKRWRQVSGGPEDLGEVALQRIVLREWPDENNVLERLWW